MSKGLGKQTRSLSTLPCIKPVLGCPCSRDVGARVETLSPPHDGILEVGRRQTVAE